MLVDEPTKTRSYSLCTFAEIPQATWHAATTSRIELASGKLMQTKPIMELGKAYFEPSSGKNLTL